ncbi:hypothetical protein [Paenibacillus alba]|uniref:Uncharacterized protein n=1 Tax=Paenibacillus alba TaxID=1197127 RepID=A0ABU6GEV8_9BACL|nr:hypothetical protein [Paenibacillus alba]MEC0232727.1 hypothetical protein [Paenibacillus alba]
MTEEQIDKGSIKKLLNRIEFEKEVNADEGAGRTTMVINIELVEKLIKSSISTREQQEEAKSWRRVAEQLEGEKVKLQQQKKQLIEALEHYAEWVDWEDDSMGDKARIALQQI